MVDQAQRGERRQKMPSHSHKSVWGQRSGKHLLWPEGTLRRWERPVAVVCAPLSFSACGWIFI